MTNEERARLLYADAMAEVKAERRATGQKLHSWRNEACLRAIIRALEDKAP
jgi:hypothetical protein